MPPKSIALTRLEDALKRLESGKPTRVKSNGKLSLNKINNEAGLGHSYIHKFTNFVQNEANPRIEAYNNKLSVLISNVHTAEYDGIKLSELDRLKLDLKREISLKKKYKKKLDDALVCKKEVEQLNVSLMFRLNELQNEINYSRLIKIHTK